MLTSAQACKLLGVGRLTFYRWLATDPTLQALVHAGGRLDLEELRAWAAVAA